MNTFTKNTLGAFVVVSLFGLALFGAKALSESDAVVRLVEQFGYFGVLLTGIIAGLNTFIPVPAATFAPIFIAAGLSIPGIIFILAVGTLIADMIGFALGHVSRELIQEKYPKIFDFFTKLQQEHTIWIIPVVILYAAFVPFPNEAILIPLALAGTKLKHLIIPLIVGNIIHQTLFVYGVTNIFSFLT